MEATLRTHLLELAAAMKTAGVSAATIGKEALNDNTFLKRVEAESCNFTIRTYDKVVAWCWKNRPANMPWPESVPAPVEVAA